MDKVLSMKCIRKGIPRLMLFILLSVVSVPMQANANGDRVDNKVFTVSVKDRPVKEVLDYIEKHSEYVFFYSPKAINTSRKVSVNVSNQRITLLLDKIFAGTDVKYDIDGYQISLKSVPTSKKNKNEVRPTVRKITGKVIDASNKEPLIGAVVQLEKGGIGVSTNIDGAFSLDVPEDRNLLVSYIGYVHNKAGQ